jgi:hypothetical protein
MHSLYDVHVFAGWARAQFPLLYARWLVGERFDVT